MTLNPAGAGGATSVEDLGDRGQEPLDARARATKRVEDLASAPLPQNQLRFAKDLEVLGDGGSRDSHESGELGRGSGRPGEELEDQQSMHVRARREHTAC